MRYHMLRRSLVALSIAVAGVALAEMPAGSLGTEMTILQDQKASPGTVRVSRLLDVTVNDPAGKDVGHVTDVILTRDDSAVSYIALAQGAPHSLGRKVLALPYASLKFGGPADRQVYVLIPGDTLAKIQGIDESMYPTGPNAEVERWLTANIKPAPAIPGGGEAIKAAANVGEAVDALWSQRCSMLIGSSVISTAGDRLGTIKDVVITPNTGVVNYAVLAQSRPLGMEGEFYAVPLDAFRPQAQTPKLILDVTPDQLSRMPSIDKDHWPTIPDPKWAALKGGGQPVMP